MLAACTFARKIFICPYYRCIIQKSVEAILDKNAFVHHLGDMTMIAMQYQFRFRVCPIAGH